MLQPIGKRILVQAVEEPQKKIFLSTHKPHRFKVVAIGDDVTKVAIGNVIYLDKYAMAELDHDGEKYLVVEENNILAKTTE